MSGGSVYQLIRGGKKMRRADGSTIWCVDYKDAKGKRVTKSIFHTKREAEQFLETTNVSVRAGTHTPDRDSITVSEACDVWISHVEGVRERSTVKQYREHAENHIKPRIGSIRLSQLTRADVRGFEADMRREVSETMARKTLTSLKALINVAMDYGKVATNVALGVSAETSARKGGELRIEDAEIPSKEELNRMLTFTRDHYPTRYPLLYLVAFTGMRPSEWRGLTWQNVDLDKRVIHVIQRADEWGVLGETKTARSVRSIPIGPRLHEVLSAWKEEQKRTWMEAQARRAKRRKVALHVSAPVYLFPNGRGNVESIQNLAQRFLNPMQVGDSDAPADSPLHRGAGIVGADGKHKFTFYSFRHFFASVLIDAGRSVVEVSRLMGHANPTITLNVYAHQFERRDRRHDVASDLERAVLDGVA